MESRIIRPRIARPFRYLLRMVVFLALAGLVAYLLQKQIITAFWANPALNALIGVVLVIGILFAFAQVFRLFREIRWVNSRIQPDETRAPPRGPNLLAPVSTSLAQSGTQGGLSATMFRALVDSIGGRLDESRELLRYLTGLLVFLGLLGTFWGLIETVSSIGGVIEKLPSAGENTALFDELKRSLAAPLAGMGIAFSSSLFGLAGSLALGFLDLQVGQAQNRFFYDVEEWLTSLAQDAPASPNDTDALQRSLDGISRAVGEVGAGRGTTQALSQLAEGIQSLVQHMRGEQQMIRSWVEAQSAQQAEVKRLLETLNRTLPGDEKRGA